jgi:hypothetical protein
MMNSVGKWYCDSPLQILGDWTIVFTVVLWESAILCDISHWRTAARVSVAGVILFHSASLLSVR